MCIKDACLVKQPFGFNALVLMTATINWMVRTSPKKVQAHPHKFDHLDLLLMQHNSTCSVRKIFFIMTLYSIKEQRI